VDEINKNADILPNITLGFRAYDSCAHLQYDLVGALQFLTGLDRHIPNYRCSSGVPLRSMIGTPFTIHSVLLASVLGIYKFPQISHYSTGAILSDHIRFPAHVRTVPSDIFQAKGLAHLVVYLRWTWVGLVAADNDYGQLGIQIIRQEIIKSGACVAFSENILTSYPDRNAPHIVKIMKTSTAKVVVLYASSFDAVPILSEMAKQNVTGKILVANTGWVTSVILSLDKISALLTGTIDWTKIFWEMTFNCRFISEKNETGSLDTNVKECTGSENLESMYTAIHVVANALRNMNNSLIHTLYFLFLQLLYYIKNVRFKLNSGKEVYFDKNGDPPAVYDILPPWVLESSQKRRTCLLLPVCPVSTGGDLQSNRHHHIKHSYICSEYMTSLIEFFQIYSSDSFTCVKCPWDMWPNPEKSNCLPKPIEFLSYEEPLGTTLACTSAISSLIPVVILKLFLQFKTTPIVKANNYSLSCLLLLSLSFCFLSSLMFIGFPKAENCLVRQAAFGMVFSLCVCCILAKTIMVVFAFMAIKPGSNMKKWTSPWMSYMIISICLFLQFILCITWLSLDPPFLEQNIEIQPGLIILQCNEGSSTAFWCMLGYLGLLATISFVVAFLARRLPGSFNEAKYITFSMLAFLSVWVSYIPASLSSQGKYTVAMEVFAILASSWAIVFCMFAPKCFIILFRPSMNSREYVMKKGQNIK
uniref:G-protein coupled receptors family 3 profile domain-containing protein n=1 Tax=Leptobrachium leishanense TaxID=445787 RepID=A0A8C5MN81_9ANUR